MWFSYSLGRFGMGVKAYFVFLTYLLILNLLHSLIIIGTVLIPTLVYRGNGVYTKGDSTLMLQCY